MALNNIAANGTAGDDIHKADIRLSDICTLVADDWPRLAAALDVQPDDVATIRAEFEDRDAAHQAMVMLRLWLRSNGRQATGNQLEGALHAIGRSDVVEKCIFNLELVTDVVEREAAKRQLVSGGGGGGGKQKASLGDQSGFGDLRAELGHDDDEGDEDGEEVVGEVDGKERKEQSRGGKIDKFASLWFKTNPFPSQSTSSRPIRRYCRRAPNTRTTTTTMPQCQWHRNASPLLRPNCWASTPHR